MKKKIIVFTGGTGRFAQIFREIPIKEKIFFPNKNELNIENLNSIKKYLKKVKPGYLIHTAALSRPMNIHEKDITKSINTNIIGTANIVNACQKENIKLIYFSTNYVYPGKKGNYKENDPVLPWNNYGWSKLGAESAVQMYKNSLIIRACMTEKPFIHKEAFTNVKCNFIFHDEFIKILLKVINFKGVINIGGKSQTIYQFAKKYKKNVKKKKSKGELPAKIYMSLAKVNNLLKK